MHLLLQQKRAHSKSIRIGKTSKNAMKKNMICRFRIGSDESKPKSAIVSLRAKLSLSKCTIASNLSMYFSTGKKLNVTILRSAEKSQYAFAGSITFSKGK